MKQYEDVKIEIICMLTDVIRTSGSGNQYEEDINWGI